MNRIDSGTYKIDGILNKSYSYIIPIYQRDYAWQNKQYRYFYEHIIEHMENMSGKEYFMGFLIFKCCNDGIYIVDGQQRLTTISLLLKAIQIRMTELNNEYQYEIKTMLLHKGRTNEMPIITHHTIDTNDYCSIMQKDVAINNNSKISQAFNFFKKQLNGKDVTFLERLFDYISTNLTFQVSALSSDVDEFEIFQNINSSGKPLTPGEMWYNSLFMFLNGANDYYEKLSKIKVTGDEDLTFFIKCWYFSYTGKMVGRSYDSIIKPLNEILQKTNKDIFLDQLIEFSDLYHSILSQNFNGLSDKMVNYLRNSFIDRDEFKMFVMHVIYSNSKRIKPFTDNFLIGILKTFEKILLRECICNHTWLFHIFDNMTFEKITDNVEEAQLDECVKNMVTLIEDIHHSNFGGIDARTKHIIPDNEEFAEALKDISLYTKRNGIAAYTLAKIAEEMNHNNKECYDILWRLKNKHLTIEHIIPQKVTKEWEDMLGESCSYIYENKIHSLSNLTITAYNSEYSNKPFNVKVTMQHGYKDSIYNMTNFLAKFEKFGLKEMQQREEEMVDAALNYCNIPFLDEIHEKKKQVFDK